MDKRIIFAILLFITANILTWFQVNSQFLWTWWKEHPITTILIYSVPTSFSFFYAWKFGVESMAGELWPVKMIGFGVSTIIFTLITYVLMKEGLSAKTLVCLALSLAIILIQILWK